jgi:hypothetical protein
VQAFNAGSASTTTASITLAVSGVTRASASRSTCLRAFSGGRLWMDDEVEKDPAVKTIVDIRRVRGSDFVNTFWRALANDPANLKHTWESVKVIMYPQRIGWLRSSFRIQKTHSYLKLA